MHGGPGREVGRGLRRSRRFGCSQKAAWACSLDKKQAATSCLRVHLCAHDALASSRRCVLECLAVQDPTLPQRYDHLQSLVRDHFRVRVVFTLLTLGES